MKVPGFSQNILRGKNGPFSAILLFLSLFLKKSPIFFGVRWCILLLLILRNFSLSIQINTNNPILYKILKC